MLYYIRGAGLGREEESIMFRPVMSETVELPLLMLLKGGKNMPAHTLVRQVQ